METYEPSKIGERISWGREHFVYHYGEHEVIKLPTADLIAWGSNLRLRYERDLAVAKKYLGEYMLDTRIVEHPTTKRIATIQPFVTGHTLAPELLADVEIKDQFSDFMARHDQLVSAGYQPLDLIGEGGVFHRRLSNIMVLPDKRLRLFDILIADTYGMRHFQRLAFLLRGPVLRRQAATIQYFKEVARSSGGGTTIGA